MRSKHYCTATKCYEQQLILSVLGTPIHLFAIHLRVIFDPRTTQGLKKTTTKKAKTTFPLIYPLYAIIHKPLEYLTDSLIPPPSAKDDRERASAAQLL